MVNRGVSENSYEYIHGVTQISHKRQHETLLKSQSTLDIFQNIQSKFCEYALMKYSCEHMSGNN